MIFGTPQFCVTQLGWGVVGGLGGGTTVFGDGEAADGLRRAGSPAVGAVSAGALVCTPAAPLGAVLFGTVVDGDVVPVAPPEAPPVPPVCDTAAPTPPTSRQRPSVTREMNEAIVSSTFPSSMDCLVRGNASSRAYVPATPRGDNHAAMRSRGNRSHPMTV